MIAEHSPCYENIFYILSLYNFVVFVATVTVYDGGNVAGSGTVVCSNRYPTTRERDTLGDGKGLYSINYISVSFVPSCPVPVAPTQF